jgi:hypothetical protein
MPDKARHIGARSAREAEVTNDVGVLDCSIPVTTALNAV